MLRSLLIYGDTVESRNGSTIELATQTITIEQPTQRFLHTPRRNNNPFAAIAETMWVLAGRNDLAFLTPYLKRAPDYSDDGGKTWRAGYGPRLRNWGGVDQLAEARSLLGGSISRIVRTFPATIGYISSSARAASTSMSSRAVQISGSDSRESTRLSGAFFTR